MNHFHFRPETYDCGIQTSTVSVPFMEMGSGCCCVSLWNLLPIHLFRRTISPGISARLFHCACYLREGGQANRDQRFTGVFSSDFSLVEHQIRFCWCAVHLPSTSYYRVITLLPIAPHLDVCCVMSRVHRWANGVDYCSELVHPLLYLQPVWYHDSFSILGSALTWLGKPFQV